MSDTDEARYCSQHVFVWIYVLYKALFLYWDYGSVHRGQSSPLAISWKHYRSWSSDKSTIFDVEESVASPFAARGEPRSGERRIGSGLDVCSPVGKVGWLDLFEGDVDRLRLGTVLGELGWG